MEASEMRVRWYKVIILIGLLGLVGFRPLGAHESENAPAPKPSKGIAYVAMGPSHNVAAIDIATGRVVGTLAAGWNTHGVAATPDGRYLVTTSRQLKNNPSPLPIRVSILDTKTFQTVARIDVGGDSHHAFVNPKGTHAYVSVPVKEGIAVIDIPNRRVIKHVPTGKKANSIVTSPNGELIYVTNKGDDTLSVIDAKALEVVATILLGIGPDHLAIDESGQWLYVSNAFSNDVSIVDVEGNEEVGRVPLAQGPHGLGLSRDGKTLYVASRGGKVVSSIDLQSQKVVQSRPIGEGPGHVTVTPDGKGIYVNDEKLGKIWVLEPGTLKVKTDIHLWPEPHETTFVLPSGKEAADENPKAETSSAPHKG
jgi:YVTN family beta-propeller protein